MFLVMAERRQDHLDFVTHIVRKQRAQGTVNHARVQNRLFRRATFTAEKAAGDTSRSIHFLFKINT